MPKAVPKLVSEMYWNFLREGDYGGIVAQEGHDRTERCDTGQVEQGLHQRLKQLLHQRYDTELHEQTPYGTGYDTYSHEVEYGVEQQVVARVHNRVQHIGHPHFLTYEPENAKYYQQTDTA